MPNGRNQPRRNSSFNNNNDTNNNNNNNIVSSRTDQINNRRSSSRYPFDFVRNGKRNPPHWNRSDSRRTVGRPRHTFQPRIQRSVTPASNRWINHRRIHSLFGFAGTRQRTAHRYQRAGPRGGWPAFIRTDQSLRQSRSTIIINLQSAV